MFDLDQFIADCRAALAADKSHKSVREVVARAVSDPATILKGLGEPKRSEVQKLYHSSDLTILNVIWAPRMTIMPHNHQMWAVIGIYTGREDNIFWRRVPGRTAASWKPWARGPCLRKMLTPWVTTSSIR
jgi:predicted metal-dependent enzyme (double-stranded beta helix superfamily)